MLTKSRDSPRYVTVTAGFPPLSTTLKGLRHHKGQKRKTRDQKMQKVLTNA
jgi:hypothetical protein